MSKFTLVKGITLAKDGVLTLCSDLQATPVPAAQKSNLQQFTQQPPQITWELRRFHCSLSCPRFLLYKDENGRPYAILKCGLRDFMIEAGDLEIELPDASKEQGKSVKLGK